MKDDRVNRAVGGCAQLSRDTVKWIAILAMTVDHIAITLLPPTTLLYLLCEVVGNFTAITMCYFLAEGFYLTRQRRAYALRLFLFACLSQIPFQLAFERRTGNMLFTLLLCFGILCIQEYLTKEPGRAILSTLLVAAGYFCDWPVLIPVQTVFFWRSKHAAADPAGIRRAQKRSYVLFACMLFAAEFLNRLGALFREDPLPYFTGLPQETWASMPLMGRFVISAGFAGLSILPVFLSMTLTLDHCRIKHTKRPAAIQKWAFYAYYPLHLLVLWLVRKS